MRKIESSEEKERKRKRNTFLVSIVLLGIMVISTASFAFTSYQQNKDPSQQVQKEGLQNINGVWQLTKDGRTFIFQYSPDELKNVSTVAQINLLNYAGKQVYIDAANPAVVSTLAATLGQYAARVQEGCYGICNRDLPEKNCTDVMVIWRDSPQTKITQEENCVFIDGDMRAIEAFLYRLLGY